MDLRRLFLAFMTDGSTVNLMVDIAPQENDSEFDRIRIISEEELAVLRANNKVPPGSFDIEKAKILRDEHKPLALYLGRLPLILNPEARKELEYIYVQTHGNIVRLGLLGEHDEAIIILAKENLV